MINCKFCNIKLTSTFYPKVFTCENGCTYSCYIDGNYYEYPNIEIDLYFINKMRKFKAFL